MKTHLWKLSPYLVIALVVLIYFIFVAFKFPLHRVGDGMEYYGLYYAWDISHRPWMTPQAFEAYDQLVASNQIVGMLPGDFLKQAFPALQLGKTMDFNHFWFYSFLAFLCNKMAGLLGVHLQIHQSFLMLHCILLTTTTWISYNFFKWPGVFIVLLMTFLSPILWFTNKVHTEFFTYCLVLSAVMLIYSKKYIPSALFLAIASTQNISFALIAAIPLLYRVTLERKKPYTLADVMICSSIAILILAHPVYYFSRYGVVSPQFLAGGASLGGNLSTFYIWLIDPDLGLLPNWPIGLLALLSGSMLWLFNKQSRQSPINKAYLMFFVFYMLINFYAHSSTMNLNSGATPGLARYALWYLPLAFPPLYWMLNSINWRQKKFLLIMPLALFLAYFSLKSNNPKKHESYTTPTRLSYFIQSKTPWLYNPPEEVFLERYSGFGESAYALTIKIVTGPDCQKLLVFNDSTKENVTFPEKCHFDASKLRSFIDSKAFSNERSQYYYLTEKESNALKK
ncbi:MAG: hypothetical protein ACHQAX_09575 [Gammaproteobacteria bacterium]